MNMHLTPEQRTIAQQRVRIEKLEEELRQIKEDLAPVVIFPRGWNLTPAERQIVMVLYRSKAILTHSQLAASIGSNATDPKSNINVILSKLRKKLEPFGVQIVNIYGAGFEMPTTSKVIVRVALTQSVTA